MLPLIKNIDFKNFRMMYWVVIVIAILSGLGVVGSRLMIESSSRNVELIMSYNTLQEMAKSYGMPLPSLIEKVCSAGITSIAIEERSLENLQKEGKMSWLTYDQVKNSSRYMKNASPVLNYINANIQNSPEYNYLVFDDALTMDSVKDNLILQLGPDRVKPMNMNVLEVRGAQENIKQLPLGFAPEAFHQLASSNVNVIARLQQSFYLDDDKIAAKIAKLASLEVPIDKVIFEGETILGFKKHLKAVAGEFKKYNIYFGFVEFAFQKGEDALAAQMPEMTMKVHSIPTEELSNYTVPQAIKRYIRAVNERKIRLLFVNPFTNMELGPDMLTLNTTYINDLASKLHSAGYNTGKASQLDFPLLLSLNFFNVLLLILGIWSIFMLVIDRFIDLGWIKHYSASAVVLLVAIILSVMHKSFNFIPLLALSSAILFPVYAIISQFPQSKYDPPKSLKEVVFSTFLIWLISMCGAFFVIIALTRPEYMVGVKNFPGVKLAFLLPLAVTCGYFFIEPDRLGSIIHVIRRTLVRPITVAYVAGFGILAVLLLFYIVRSGNNTVVPVSAHEAHFREILERLLYARPRTKEILLAYPALMFALYGVNRFFKFSMLWVGAVIATIAPISIINTFAHIHSPLLISLLRSFNGLIVGSIIGILVIYGYKFAQKIFTRISANQ